MIIRTAEPDDFPRCRDLLQSSVELGFDPGVVAEEKLFGPGYGGPARCRVALEKDAIRGIVVTSGSAVRLLAVEPDYRGHGIGSALLEDAIQTVNLSFPRVVIGAAPGNYLVPGVPADDRETISFFQRRGFAISSETIDMTADLDEPDPAPRSSEIAMEQVTAFDETLEKFLETGFGPAIAWEIGRGILSGIGIVRLAFSDDQIVGFTACEINNAGLGTFGPQGVAENARGRGIGRLLLHASLADLRQLGHERARIPWVSSPDYYERNCGAEVAGRYVVLRRE